MVLALRAARMRRASACCRAGQQWGAVRLNLVLGLRGLGGLTEPNPKPLESVNGVFPLEEYHPRHRPKHHPRHHPNSASSAVPAQHLLLLQVDQIVHEHRQLPLLARGPPLSHGVACHAPCHGCRLRHHRLRAAASRQVQGVVFVSAAAGLELLLTGRHLLLHLLQLLRLGSNGDQQSLLPLLGRG